MTIKQTAVAVSAPVLIAALSTQGAAALAAVGGLSSVLLS
jgi:hypothetical protein